MKVYMRPQPWMGRGIHHVAEALEKYRPEGVQVVRDRDRADLEIIHVVGWGSLPKDLGVHPYAIVQYCYQTTENPKVDDWLPIWKPARAVWSYYSLPGQGYRHVYQPLGVDPAVFHEHSTGKDREYVITTHGYVAETEAVFECHNAAARLKLNAAHLGPNLSQGGITYHGLPEDDVAALWSRSERVAALRRIEGFELPGIEGLLCGARPVAFDASHYHAWYRHHADYVPEVEPAELTEILATLLSIRPRPVSELEREEIREEFSWPKLTANFWRAVL